MRYYGGKSVCGKKIAQYILTQLNEKKINFSKITYIECFCGALGVFRHIAPYIKKTYANDISKDLILLWKQVQKGNFKNPKIDRNKWKILKYSEIPSAERAFAGHGCSFGGVFFNGYISDGNNNDMTYNTLIKMEPIIKNTVFTSLDYREQLNKIIKNDDRIYVIYMDPPYKDTCVDPFEKFDNNQFWETVREYSKLKNVIIFISEISAPKDMKEVFSFQRRSGMHNTTVNNQIYEKIYTPKN